MTVSGAFQQGFEDAKESRASRASRIHSQDMRNQYEDGYKAGKAHVRKVYLEWLHGWALVEVAHEQQAGG